MTNFPYQKFHDALDRGDFQLVGKLLANYPDNKLRDEGVVWFVEHGCSTEALRFLLENEFSPNIGSPLRSAFRKSNLEAAEILLQAGADPNDGALKEAVKCRDSWLAVQFIKLLTLHGAHADRDQLIAECDDTVVFEYLRYGKEPSPPAETQNPVSRETGTVESNDAEKKFCVTATEVDRLVEARLSLPKLLARLAEVCDLTHKMDEIIAFARPAFMLKTTPVCDESRVEPGCSRLGGLPDLPIDETWPKHQNGRPLAFLGQLNFSELPEPTGVFPSTGILFVFSVFGFRDSHGSMDSFTWDKERDSSWTKIIYGVDEESLQRCKKSEKVNYFPPATIQFVPTISLPNEEREPDWAQFEWEASDIERFHHLSRAYRQVVKKQNGIESNSQLGGFACFEDGFIEHVADCDYHLLLQIAKEPASKMYWGGGGSCYAWIHPSDLRRRVFSDIWVESQWS